MQDTFLKAYKSLHSFRHESSIIVWLNKIAYNRLLDYYKKKSLQAVSIDDEGLASKLIDWKKDLSKETEQRLMSECVQNKISSLPKNYIAPLFLDMNGYTNLEISKITNTSLENTKIRLHRARQKIRKILENDCSIYHDERNVMC